MTNDSYNNTSNLIKEAAKIVAEKVWRMLLLNYGATWMPQMLVFQSMVKEGFHLDDYSDICWLGKSSRYLYSVEIM